MRSVAKSSPVELYSAHLVVTYALPALTFNPRSRETVEPAAPRANVAFGRVPLSLLVPHTAADGRTDHCHARTQGYTS